MRGGHFMACYLFVHFIGEQSAHSEQVYFSVSPDGLHWQDLNQGQPVLCSSIVETGKVFSAIAVRI